MHVIDYLKKHQPLVARTFQNALLNDRLAHAYLLAGTPGMPLKEIAVFLAMSILCEKRRDGLACGVCGTCQRVLHDECPDVMVIDPGAAKIKKGDVQAVITNFSKTALDKTGIMIYVLHRAENMTPVAVNSLLKFLEEPGQAVYALLTSENEARILPTIRSRTEVLHLKPVDKMTVRQEAIELGVPEDDAELLSHVHNDAQMIREAVDTELYQTVKAALWEIIPVLSKGSEEALYVNDRRIVPKIRSVAQAGLYLDLFAGLLNDLITARANVGITSCLYAKITGDAGEQLARPEEKLLLIMTARDSLKNNVNIPLLLDALILKITEADA